MSVRGGGFMRRSVAPVILSLLHPAGAKTKVTKLVRVPPPGPTSVWFLNTKEACATLLHSANHSIKLY